MTLLAGLQGILDSRNMKPADLCRLCGLSTGVMSNYMNGKRVPSIANAITIANAQGADAIRTTAADKRRRSASRRLPQLHADLERENRRVRGVPER